MSGCAQKSHQTQSPPIQGKTKSVASDQPMMHSDTFDARVSQIVDGVLVGATPSCDKAAAQWRKEHPNDVDGAANACMAEIVKYMTQNLRTDGQIPSSGDNLSQCDNDSMGVKGCRYLLATWKQDPIPIPNEAVVIGPFEKGGCGAFERLVWPQIRGDYQAQQAPTQEPFAVECVSKNMMASRLTQFMCHQDTEPMDLSKRYGIERSAWHYTCILVQQLGR